MTTQDMLDERYGRRRTPAQRWLVFGGIALAIAVVVGFAWMTVASSMEDVRADSTAYSIIDERSIEVAFQFTAPPGRSVACALEAQDESKGIVGWKIVEYEASDLHARAFRETVPTTALAVTGFVNACWVT